MYDKMVFGLAENPDILAALERTGRKTAVLVGLETDVCLATGQHWRPQTVALPQGADPRIVVTCDGWMAR